MSWSVLLSACPMCSEPVTFGGGMTMQKLSALGSFLGLNAPDDSHAWLQRGSTSFGLNVVSIITEHIAAADAALREGRDPCVKRKHPGVSAGARLEFRCFARLARQARYPFKFGL